MTTSAMATDNPFVDPASSFEDGRGNSFEGSTLSVARDASLTLGTDSLIVLDEAFEKRDRSNCCGLWPSGTFRHLLSYSFC
jgi:sphingosine kinase